MICKKCGLELEENAIFCSRCGSRVDAQEQNNAQNTYYTPPYNNQYNQPNQPYNQYPNNSYQPYTQSTSAPGQGMAVASLVMGIMSLIIFAIIAGPLGIIFGSIAKSKGNTSGMATAGIICGICGIIGWIAVLIFFSDSLFSLY